jgi:hypothetical protein
MLLPGASRCQEILGEAKVRFFGRKTPQTKNDRFPFP